MLVNKLKKQPKACPLPQEAAHGFWPKLWKRGLLLGPDGVSRTSFSSKDFFTLYSSKNGPCSFPPPKEEATYELLLSQGWQLKLTPEGKRRLRARGSRGYFNYFRNTPGVHASLRVRWTKACETFALDTLLLKSLLVFTGGSFFIGGSINSHWPSLVDDALQVLVASLLLFWLVYLTYIFFLTPLSGHVLKTTIEVIESPSPWKDLQEKLFEEEVTVKEVVSGPYGYKIFVQEDAFLKTYYDLCGGLQKEVRSHLSKFPLLGDAPKVPEAQEAYKSWRTKVVSFQEDLAKKVQALESFACLRETCESLVLLEEEEKGTCGEA